MKLIVAAVLALVVVAALAAPVEEPIAIVRSDIDQGPDGQYTFDFETANGIAQQEQGQLKEVLDEENKSQKVITVRGSYSYVDPDGESHAITYYADETGFHAEGKDVPQDP